MKRAPYVTLKEVADSRGARVPYDAPAGECHLCGMGIVAGDAYPTIMEYPVCHDCAAAEPDVVFRTVADYEEFERDGFNN